MKILIEKCTEIVSGRDCNASELLKELAENPLLADFSFIGAACAEILSGMSFSSAFFMCADERGELAGLDNEDRVLLTEYIHCLSSLPKDILLAKSRDFIALFEKRAALAGEYSCKTGRLYVASGILCGALIVIILV